MLGSKRNRDNTGDEERHERNNKRGREEANKT